MTSCFDMQCRYVNEQDFMGSLVNMPPPHVSFEPQEDQAIEAAVSAWAHNPLIIIVYPSLFHLA